MSTFSGTISGEEILIIDQDPAHLSISGQIKGGVEKDFTLSSFKNGGNVPRLLTIHGLKDLVGCQMVSIVDQDGVDLVGAEILMQPQDVLPVTVTVLTDAQPIPSDPTPFSGAIDRTWSEPA